MPEVLEKVDIKPFKKALKEMPYQKGAVIPLLQKVQEMYKFVPEEAMEIIAEHLKMEVSQIYGVTTFYAQFRLKPVGEHIVRVCHGTACHVAGAERVTEHCEEVLGIKDSETTPDKKFTLEKVACVGCCSLAPVLMIGDETYGRLTDKAVTKILKEYKEK
ncbi:MAG: NADH-quinone oxidoreductase subunit NuoE [Calditrichia bacterium]|nr:NADH-quinone oxidoreductase subunit NuoE [Calditrichia bacterium]